MHQCDICASLPDASGNGALAVGHGWANNGYSATEIDPQARGVSFLRAEDGIPARVKAAYLSDGDIIALADYATWLRGNHALPVMQGGEAA